MDLTLRRHTIRAAVTFLMLFGAVSVAAQRGKAALAMEGESNSLDLTATFRDGAVLRVGESSKVS